MKLGIRLVSDVCLLEIEAEFDCLQLIQALKFVVKKHSILTLKEEDCRSRAYALDVLAKLYSHRVWIKEVPPEICNLVSLLDILLVSSLMISSFNARRKKCTGEIIFILVRVQGCLVGLC